MRIEVHRARELGVPQHVHDDPWRHVLGQQNDHLDRLRSAGVEMIYGEHVWPLAEPRTAGPRELPWAAILSALKPYC